MIIMKKLKQMGSILVRAMIIVSVLLLPFDVATSVVTGANVSITAQYSQPSPFPDQPNGLPHPFEPNVTLILLRPDGSWTPWSNIDTILPVGYLIYWANITQTPANQIPAMVFGQCDVTRELGSAALQGRQVFGNQQSVPGNTQLQAIVPEPVGREGIVRVSEIEQFRNNDIRFEPTNNMIADVVRQYVRQVMNQQNAQGFDNAGILSQREQQLSNNLMRDIIQVWDQDPGAQSFPVNANGMKVQLDRKAVQPFTVNQYEGAGGFSTDRISIFATHTMQDGIRTARDLEDIVFVLLYEMFGRGEGLGIILSNLRAELLMGRDAGSSHDWLRYTGFHRAIGLEHVFDVAQESHEIYDERMNERLMELNPNLPTYEQISVAMGGAGGAIRNLDSLAILARDLGIRPDQVSTFLEDTMALFHTATDMTLAIHVRNNAAQQFSTTIERIATISLKHNLGFWGVDFEGRLTSLLEGGPSIDLNSPQLGVFTLGNEHVQRPSIFSEVQEMLGEVGRQVQAGYTIQNGQWILVEHQLPHLPPTLPPNSSVEDTSTTTITTEYRTLRFVIDSTTFTDNGTSHILEAAPFIANDRTMVPLRVISEALDATNITFVNGVVSFVLNDETITMTIGQPLPNNMGTPIIIADRTFVPIAYIIDKMGAEVRWDGNTRAVYITMPL